MCRTLLIVRTSTHRRRHHRSSARRSNPSNLCHPPTLAYTDLEVMGGLWNCQSAVKKGDIRSRILDLRSRISAYVSFMTLHFLALTETWITPENSATPAGLSTVYSFSQTPKTFRVRRRDQTPHLADVVLPGPSTRTLGQICV